MVTTFPVFFIQDAIKFPDAPKCPFSNTSATDTCRWDQPGGRVAYEPNSLSEDSPREAPTFGFRSMAARTSRGRWSALGVIAERLVEGAHKYSRGELRDAVVVVLLVNHFLPSVK